MWLWLRDSYSWLIGALGGLVLFVYGIIPTFQPSHFHRIYAVCGGVFIVMALVWGWLIDGFRPDLFDVLGAIVCIIGAGVIFYWPRRGETAWSS